MTAKRTIGEIVFDSVNVIFMCLLILITTYPIIHVALASLSDGNLLMQHRGILLKPAGFSLASYKAVFMTRAVTQGYANTVFIVVAGVCTSLLLSSLGAFFMSRKGLLWQRPVSLFIVFTMFFGGGLIPFYLTVSDLGLRDTLWAVIIPYAISTYNMIIMRTSFAAIPDSLEESAKIDGANEFIILFRIILPLSMPVIAVMILYYGVHYWNSWFPAMIFIKRRTLFPLQLVLREILISNSYASMLQGSSLTDESQSIAETVKYATIMVATIPILCVYPFVQKYFVKGVMIGAVKG